MTREIIMEGVRKLMAKFADITESLLLMRKGITERKVLLRYERTIASLIYRALCNTCRKYGYEITGLTLKSIEGGNSFDKDELEELQETKVVL